MADSGDQAKDTPVKVDDAVKNKDKPAATVSRAPGPGANNKLDAAFKESKSGKKR